MILHVSQLSNVNGCFRRFAALDIDRDDAWLTFAGSVVVAALDIDRDDAWLTFAGICRRPPAHRWRQIVLLAVSLECCLFVVQDAWSVLV